ncbi:MAG: hypothetical protein WCB58_05885 [Acidobacteriaceae bacterium]
MKSRYGKLAATFGALLLALVCVPSSWAGCAPNLTGVTHSRWMVQPGGPTLLQTALEEDKNYREPSIVGFWHFKQMSGTNVFDAGYEQWHSDGTEIFNSGSRAPDTGNFCLGVWQQVGPRHYVLNHRAIGWAPGGTEPAYVAAILEDLTLNANGNSFSGSYIVTAYDLSGHFLQVVSKGKVTAERINITDLIPDALF